jgi:hypothetical protein
MSYAVLKHQELNWSKRAKLYTIKHDWTSMLPWIVQYIATCMVVKDVWQEPFPWILSLLMDGWQFSNWRMQHHIISGTYQKRLSFSSKSSLIMYYWTTYRTASQPYFIRVFFAPDFSRWALGFSPVDRWSCFIFFRCILHCEPYPKTASRSDAN